MKSLKKTSILVSPLLFLVVFVVLYSWVNQQFIVKWLGCGCPVIDEFGNLVKNSFNANDFTALFLLFISICTIAISVLFSKRIPKEKMWIRILYIIYILLTSLFISYQFYQLMLWK